MSVYIIAEGGVNHNGDYQKAFELIDIASSANADAIKFQTFLTENLVTRFAETANYQKKSASNETQFEMLKKLELPKGIHFELFDYAKEKSIDFMTTAFDSDSLKFIVNDLGLTKLKISSGDITNEPFLLEHAVTKSKIILSTGVSTLDEIRKALSVLAYGFISKRTSQIHREEFIEAYSSREGQEALREYVTVLHCVSEYPAPIEDLNLKAITTIKDEFTLPVGYSDHSSEITTPMLAVALGATVIEKHITSDKSLDGPDHQASLDSSELVTTVELIRLAENMLGDGKKIPRDSELKNKDVVRKSLFAKKKIKKGQEYTSENVSIKRPGSGMQPHRIWEIIGKKASYDLKEGEYINE
jgi:N-acetylneuraminate synthase